LPAYSDACLTIVLNSALESVMFYDELSMVREFTVDSLDISFMLHELLVH